MMVEIGKRLKRLRKEKGFTQKDLAARVSGGLDYTYIGKIERGEQLPSLKILMKLSETLAVPVGYFFLDETLLKTTDYLTPELKNAGTASDRQELSRVLKQLHEDDVPLLLEIARVLHRHREAGRRKPVAEPVGPALLAAEEKTPYGKP